MSASTSNRPDVPPVNLFTPRFGHSPHRIVGRDSLLRTLSDAMRSGAEHKHRTTLVMGPRGAGKTVMLNAVEERAAALGYTVVSVDAGTPGVLGRIVRRIALASEELPDGASLAVDSVSLSAGLSLGPLRVSRETSRAAARAEHDVRESLGALADRSVAIGGAGVLLTIDEMHRTDIDEMIRLANDLQHVSTRDEAPVMFVGASLPDIKDTLNDDRLSFFRRCADEDLAGIDAADAYAFIAGAIRDAGGTYDPGALRRLTGGVGPLPYEMQLLGDYAWRFADAPMRPVDGEAVDAALERTEREMRAKVYMPLWERLDRDEQTVLAVVADNGGAATRQHLGHVLGGMRSRLDSTVRRLEHRACLEGNDTGHAPDLLSLGPALSLAALRREARIMSAYAQGPAYTGPTRVAGASLPRCGKMMPRARKRCVLRRGHGGGCKSRM